MSTPKIFVFVNGGDNSDWQRGTALTEDGHFVAYHISSSRAFFRRDMGLTPDICDWQHEHYRAHYPGGYELIEVPVGEVLTHAGLLAAYEKHKALAVSDQSHAQEPATPEKP